MQSDKTCGHLKAMGDSTEQQQEEEGREKGKGARSTTKSNITSEKKMVDGQTLPPLSSHNGDNAPSPDREQPLGSEHAPPPASGGGEHHGDRDGDTHYRGEAVPVQETVSVHSAATQALVTGGVGRSGPRGALVMHCVTTTC